MIYKKLKAVGFINAGGLMWHQPLRGKSKTQPFVGKRADNIRPYGVGVKYKLLRDYYCKNSSLRSE